MSKGGHRLSAWIVTLRLTFWPGFSTAGLTVSLPVSPASVGGITALGLYPHTRL